MGEINSKYSSEFFQAFGIDVSSGSNKLSLGSFLNNAAAVDPNVAIDYPLLINGNSELGTSSADRDHYYVLSHEGKIVHILLGNQADYIGDAAMQTLENAISQAVADASSASTAVFESIINSFSGISLEHRKNVLLIRFPNDFEAQSKVFFKGYNLKGKVVWESEQKIEQHTFKLKGLPPSTILLEVLFKGQKYFKSVPLTGKKS